MQKDIVSLLYRIKSHIREIEKDKNQKYLLDDISSDFLEFVELVKLFLISERDSYYGYFMMNLKFQVQFDKNCIAGIELNSFPPIFVSNPLLLCKLSLKEIMYIFCHEIDHILLNHPSEMAKTNPSGNPDIYYLFNLAADASVNDRINYEIKTSGRNFLSMPEGVITSNSLKKLFQLNYIEALENYIYYYELIKDQQDGKSKPQQPQQIMSGQKNFQTGEDTRESDIITVNDCDSFSDHLWGVSDEDEAAALTRELVNSAVSMMNDETRALMPDSFFSMVEKINAPPVISWQSLLKKYAGTISASKTKTRTRLNRRQPQRFDIAGTTTEKILKIVVAIDTSASVEDEDISVIMNEILAILSKKKYEVTVIECDAEIQKVYRVKTADDIQKKVTGRGGTMFTPVIKYINNNRYFRDALLIYFTDGYGEDSIPRPKTYRNLWVVMDKAEHLSVEEPYGAVIALK